MLLKEVLVSSLCVLFLFVQSAFALSHYGCYALTGDIPHGSLDALLIGGSASTNVSPLTEGDAADVYVISGATATIYHYVFDATGKDAQNVPYVIRPSDFSTEGVWRLCNVESANGTSGVTGPASAVTGDIPTFADSTGKVLQDGGTLESSIEALTTLDLSSITTLTLPGFKNGTTSAGYLRLYENATNGSNYIDAIAPESIATSAQVRFPSSGNILSDTSTISDAIEFVINGNGSAISSGDKGTLLVPYGFTIVSATVLADQSCTAAIEVGTTTFTSYDGSTYTSIDNSTAFGPTAAVDYQDSTLTSWTTSISAGDILDFDVTANDNATRLTIILEGNRAL